MAETLAEKVTDIKRTPPIVAFFDAYERSLAALLEGTNVTVERFRALLVEATLEHRDLLDCLTTPTGRQSLISSMRKVASLGFEPGAHLGQCWILPARVRNKNGQGYIQEAHVEIGYQGYKDLMYESGLISYIRSETIYDTDRVEYSMGTGDNDYLRIQRDLGADTGEAIAYMVKIVMNNGAEYIKALTRKEIIRGHMDFTRSRDRRSGNVVGPWRDHFDAMAKKSCIIEARKDMPRKISLEIQRGVDVEFSPDIPLLEPSEDIEGNFEEIMDKGVDEKPKEK